MTYAQLRLPHRPEHLELGRACLLGLGEGGATSLGQPSGSPAASAVVVSGVLLIDIEDFDPYHQNFYLA